MHQTLCFIVLFALSASALSLPPPHDSILEKCKMDRPVTEDLLSELHANPVPLLADPETRCFTACILTENQTLKPDGTLNIERVIKYTPNNIDNREKVIEAFTSCANESEYMCNRTYKLYDARNEEVQDFWAISVCEKGVDSCETAYKTAVCVNNNDVITKMRESQ